MDVGDEWSVGFALPLANADIEGILAVDEQVEVPRRVLALGVGPGKGVCEGSYRSLGTSQFLYIDNIPFFPTSG